MSFSLRFFGLVISAALVPAQLTHAATKPQLFGTQPKACSPLTSDDDELLVVSDEKTKGFQMWDVGSRRPLWKSDDYFLAFPPVDENTNRTSYIVVARGIEFVDGELSDLEGAKLELLDAHTGRFMRQMDSLTAEDEDAEDDAVLDYAISFDTKKFYVATDEHLRIYDIDSGLVSVKKWQGLKSEGGIWAAAFVFEGENIQVIAYDKGNVTFDSEGNLVRRWPALKPPAGEVPEFDYFLASPDDLLLVEQFADTNKSHIYRIKDGKLLWKTADWLTFSMDGKFAYVPSQSGLDVLDAHTGRKLKSLSGPKEYGFSISSDGNWLYEARDGKIYRWPTR